MSGSAYSCMFSRRMSTPSASSISTRDTASDKPEPQSGNFFFLFLCKLVDLSAVSVCRVDHHTKLSSMLEHSRKESTSRGLISCWWSAASMLSGHPAASLLKAAWRNAQGINTRARRGCVITQSSRCTVALMFTFNMVK